MTRHPLLPEYWFAWRPVRTPSGWRWLTWVVRFQVDNGAKGSQGHDWWWEYY